MTLRKSFALWATLLCATGAWAAVDGIELQDWRLQDATVVEAQARREGWFRQDSAKCPTEGREISKNGFDATGWYKATVPGTVLTTLVDNGVYPEPLYAENNRPEKIPESLCRHDWWYRTKVKVPESFKGRQIWLHFEGINYFAEIWVNGRIAGRMMGAFRRGSFDLARCDVKPGKDVSIAVRISPQPTVGVPSEHVMGSTGGPCGGVARLDGPTFGCAVGWDWMSGIRDRNSGIWRRVRLEATGPVVVRDPAVVTDLPDLPRTDKATVAVTVPVKNTTEKPVSGKVTIAFDGLTLEKPVALAAWRGATVAFTPDEFAQLTVKNPKLWWPAGLGEPNLHTLKITFTAADGSVSDVRETTFGIRRFDFFQGGGNFQLSVNGVRVFMKGGNWGMDEALKRVRRERIDHQVRLHREANLNMIRDWGGQSQSDELADACDKYGILLWEDFWQFNSVDPLNTALYLDNVRDVVRRLRTHPSIVIWGARNEATPPKYLEDEMRDLLLEEDPTRHYQPNSGGGFGFNSGGPYDWTPTARLSRFLEDPSFNRNETFKTEIGGISIPTIDSLMTMFPAEDWEGITDSWAEHNITCAGGRKYLRNMASIYGPARNLPDFVRKAQLMNYDNHRAIFEGRMGRMFAPMEGALLWMSIPAQPSLIWQILPYDLDPNAAFFGVQKSCEMRHVCFNESASGGVIQVIDHLTPPFAGKVKARYLNLDGTVAGEQDFAVATKGVETVTLGDVAWPAGLSKVHFIELTMTDDAGGAVSENFYWHNRACNPEKREELKDEGKLVRRNDLTDLDTLPTVTLAAKVVSREKSGRTLVGVELKNPSKSVALMVHLQLRGKKSGARVLPTSYSDNYVSLAPGKTKRILISCETADLRGEAPYVTLDGWNVTVTASGMIGPNEVAKVDAKQWAHQRGFGFKGRAQVARDVVRVNCGGYNRGNFTQDPGFLEGAVGYQTEDMDLAGCEHPGPADIYRTVRWGDSEYTNLLTKANHPHTVRLHFAEHSKEKGPGKNMMEVLANGKPILQDFDPAFAGIWKAGTKTVEHVMSDAEGRVILRFQKGRRIGKETRDARINGFEIIPE